MDSDDEMGDDWGEDVEKESDDDVGIMDKAIKFNYFLKW